MLGNAAGDGSGEGGLAGEALIGFEAAVVAETGFGGGIRGQVLRALQYYHAAGSAASFGAAGVHPINSGGLQCGQNRLPLGYVHHNSAQIRNR